MLFSLNQKIENGVGIALSQEATTTLAHVAILVSLITISPKVIHVCLFQCIFLRIEVTYFLYDL